VFAANDGTNGRELWASDGTAAGTLMLTDRRNASSSPGPAVFMSGYWYFAADDGERGRELWRSNGTGVGTEIVLDIRPGAASSGPVELAAIGGRLYFSADDGVHGREPWISDGTTAGTRLLADLVSGPGFGPDSAPARFQRFGDSVVFVAWEVAPYRGWGRIALYRTDGAGAVKLMPLGGRNTSSPPVLFEAGGRLHAIDETALGFGGGSGRLVATDGAPGSLLALGSVAVQPQVHPGPTLTTAGGRFFYRAPCLPASPAVSCPSDQVALWMSNATPSGTVPLRSFGPASAPTDAALAPMDLVELNGRVLFVGDDPGSGRELWRSDGTPSGTMLLADILPGPSGSSPSGLLRVGGFVYFGADDGAHGREMWRTDATSAGTGAVHVEPGTERQRGQHDVPSVRTGPVAAGDGLGRADEGQLLLGVLQGRRGAVRRAGHRKPRLQRSRRHVLRGRSDGTRGGVQRVGVVLDGADDGATGAPEQREAGEHPLGVEPGARGDAVRVLRGGEGSVCADGAWGDAWALRAGAAE
jgi:ELWxxDGT repeat protein